MSRRSESLKLQKKFDVLLRSYIRGRIDGIKMEPTYKEAPKAEEPKAEDKPKSRGRKAKEEK